MTPSPTEADVFTAARIALLAVLPDGTEVVKALVNRVAEPRGQDFCVVTIGSRTRLRTNVDGYEDVLLVGSIAGTVLTVSAVSFGEILPGATLFGTGVVDGTKVGDQVSGPPGGPGVYKVSPSQTLSSRALASGAKTLEQGTRVAMQVDVHGPNSGDNAQVISTVFRDEVGVALFEDQDLGVTPLYADDPQQRPFINAEQQYEWRWVVEAMLQVNPVVRVGLQFADSVAVDVVSVEAEFPPS